MIFHLPPIPFLVCFFQFGLAVSSLTKLTLRSRCEFRPDDAFDLNRLLPRQVLIYGPSGAQQLFLNHPCIDILKWSSCLFVMLFLSGNFVEKAIVLKSRYQNIRLPKIVTSMMHM